MSELQDVLRAIEDGRARGERMALATVVGVTGSTYRREGARLLVPAEGRPVGTISGGCLEGEVREAAVQVMKEGGITGMNGIIIGLAALYEMDGVCLLGETSGYLIDAGAARAILEALSRLLAETFGLRNDQVSLSGGESSRLKRFQLAGVDLDDFRRLLERSLEPGGAGAGPQARLSPH